MRKKTYWKQIDYNKINIFSEVLPSSFDKFKILQISDLHNRKFGKNNEHLIKYIYHSNADIIVMTGDIYTGGEQNMSSFKSFMTHVSKIAPVFYVLGNHEISSGRVQWIKEVLKNTGVICLDDAITFIYKGKQRIQILGISDPFKSSQSQKFFERENGVTERFKQRLNSLIQKSNDKDFRLLISHRPEFANEYAKHGIDLVLSGHAHGGQFRLPGVGGIFAPHQGFFPKYSEGVHLLNKTNIIISRGLGNSTIPFRINNRPELLEIILNCC